MNNMKFLLLATAFNFFIINTSSAVVRGGEITYTYQGNQTYEVMFTLYRDCADTSLNLPDSCAHIATTPGSKYDIEPLDLKLFSISRLPSLCGKDTTTCLPANTSKTGNGIEKHVYRAIVSLDSPRYKRFANYDEVEFRIYLTRSTDYTTISTFGHYYNSAGLNLKDAAGNSSPQLSLDPVYYLPCNHPAYLNWGAHDLKDFDSLSYTLSNPMADDDIPLSYNTGFSAQKPLSVYDPFHNGSINPFSKPPIGFYLDPTTGDMVFTSVSCSEKSISVLHITEWRKDAAGNMVKVGWIRRDISYFVQSTPNNNPPSIIATTKYRVCEGDKLCFQILSDDRTVVPPPPAPIPDDDTVKLTWNNGIPGATFTIIDPSAMHQEGRFCWTTKAGDARSAPYAFIVTARDDNCPINAISTKSFSIQVDAELSIDLGKDTLIPRGASVILDAGPGAVQYSWSTGDTTRFITADTFGTYIVYAFNACNTDSDTIEIGELLGLDNLRAGELTISPNPTNGEFIIHTSRDHERYISVSVLNWQGQEIMTSEQIIRDDRGDYCVKPHTKIPQGTYVVQVVFSDGVVFNAMLVVQ